MIEIDRSGSPARPVSYDGVLGHSWLSKSELGWLISRLPASGIFVEVGTAAGATAAMIAGARPGLRVVCVDTFVDVDAPHVVAYDPVRPNLWHANRRPNMNLFLGTLPELARLAPGLRADAILVDGDHGEAGVLADLEVADAMLAEGGAIYAHDCDEPGHPGVTVAVDRFSAGRRYACVGQHWTLRELRK